MEVFFKNEMDDFTAVFLNLWKVSGGFSQKVFYKNFRTNHVVDQIRAQKLLLKSFFNLQVALSIFQKTHVILF